MCEFCENIVKESEWVNARAKGKDFIYKDDDGYGILIDTGDSGCLGNLENISHCPYFGRELVLDGCDRKDLENKIKELESELAVKENLLKIKAGIQEDFDMQYAKLRIAELEDRYQSDCITINQLNTTIDVLVDKLNTLRKLNGL